MKFSKNGSDIALDFSGVEALPGIIDSTSNLVNGLASEFKLFDEICSKSSIGSSK